jgi:hypothetical protein
VSEVPKVTTKIPSPLDELFNTVPHDLAEADAYETMQEGELATIQGKEAPPEKDEEDVEIDEKIDAVYTAAVDAFNKQTEYMEVIEPRYAARNAEVAANYLNIALGAATARAKVKGDRKKNAAFVPFSNNRADGTVVASREDIMRMISIDAEMKNV